MSDQSSLSRFRSLLDAALQDYEKQTGTELVDTVEPITAVFQEQARVLREFRDNGKVMKSLNGAVNILYTLSTSMVLGESIGLACLYRLRGNAGF
jgi:hypothetical protein